MNSAALSLLGITEKQLSTGMQGDPKVQAGPIYIQAGLFLRLTRNLDKPRGFVNGALGEVVEKLSEHTFTLRLTTGVLLLVHPVTVGEATFLPCAYGYATTIRKAQGQSLDLGCLYFNHKYPPERGYGYVGASRFRTRAGLYLFGKVRRTDWLPVGKAIDSEQLERGNESKDEDYDSQDEDNELNYGTESDPEGDENDHDYDLVQRHLRAPMTDGLSDGEEDAPVGLSMSRGRSADLSGLDME